MTARSNLSDLRSFARSAAIAVAVLGAATTASAAPPYKPSDGVPDLGRSVASADDATAIMQNPALLPLMPDAELRWQTLQTGEYAPIPSRGHAFSLALPLWVFGTGLRLDAIDPPAAVGGGFNDPFFWLRWGLGFQLSEHVSAGATFAWSFAREAAFDDRVTVTAGLSWRPSSYVSFGLVGRDLNQASTGPIERSYTGGFVLRPIGGHRRLEVGLEATLNERSLDVTPRLVAGLDVPYIGRLRGDLRLLHLPENPQIAALLGVDIHWGGLQASAGASFGPGIGTGFIGGAAVRLFRDPGLPLPSRMAKISIDATPGVRGHTRLLRKLWRLAHDPEVEGVAFVMRAEPASSLAHAEELGDAIRLLRSKGKKSFCHLEDAGGKSLYVCAQTDRIALNPAGGLRYAGLSSRYMLLGGLIEKLGLRADFVRIGAHKTAAEQLTMAKSTDVARADHQELVDELERVFLSDVGGGRKIPYDDLKKRIAKGPFIATEAREAGLVDSLAYPDEVGRVAEEVMGRPVLLTDEGSSMRPSPYWGEAPKIAIVYLSGDMVDGESRTIPILDMEVAGSVTIARALRRAREDRSVKAVVFRIETGGGSSLAADVILREAQLTAKAKPFIVSMGTSAASGGYYASVAGKRIFANRSTITGSIGIFYGKADVQGLTKWLGANVELHRSAPRADAESLYRPFTDDERAELGRKVKQFYDTFIGRVCEGRGMKPEEVDAIARGKVWTGAQAKDRKLVDVLGGLREAIAEAKKLGDLPDDAQVLELPEEEDSLFGTLLKLAGIRVSASLGLGAASAAPLLYDVARLVAPLLVFDGQTPLALAEVVEESSFGGAIVPRSKDSAETPSLPPRGSSVETP